MKICVDCGEKKPVEDFSRLKAAPNGIRNFCKVCANRKARDWNIANPDKYRAKEQKRRLKKYGITDLSSLGEPVCGACGSLENLCIDHDHACCGKRQGLPVLRLWMVV